MPELPEVETVRQTLRNFILGKKITDVIFFYDLIVKHENKDEFRNRLIGQVFRDIRRKGKYLMFDLDDYTLVSHLRMEGKYFIRKSKLEFTKHDHIVFVLDENIYLSYHDVRKFGTMELVDKYQEQELESIQVLGMEINDPKLNSNYLYPLIKKAARPIKSILLVQNIVCGLGNIYVDETLYLAKINPKRLGNSLNVYQVIKIIKAAKSVIDRAIVMGGTTIRTYQSSLGVDGRFQNELNVHTLVDQKCKACDDIIVKTKVGGRGTYYCPTCQREKDLLILGLTGGIASGKSSIANLFKEQKISVIDADKIYKNLLKTDKIMYNEIVKTFGVEIVSHEQINLKMLGEIIFSDANKRDLLNKITHPRVLVVMNEAIEKSRKLGEKIIVIDVPLLFEAKLDYLADLIILAYTKKETQIERLIARDSISRSEALKKIESQLDLETKKQLSDIVIDNSDSIEYTKKQFAEIYNNLRSDANVI